MHSELRGLTPVLRAAGDIDLQRRDFIVMQEQMINDIAGIETALNALWEHPLKTLGELLWEEKNIGLVTKYNLSFA